MVAKGVIFSKSGLLARFTPAEDTENTEEEANRRDDDELSF